MEPLSDKQVTLINQRIIADGVTDRGLQNDLLDHFCCFIEEKMLSGLEFESAYTIAFNTITPNGMDEIQDELYYLLTLKQLKLMKSTIYGFGFLATFCLSTSTLFKAMHWLGAKLFLFAGFVFLLLAAITLFVNALKHMRTHTLLYNTQVVMGFIAVFLISVGGIFKILGYPTANLDFLIGMLLLNFIFLPLFFYHLYTESLLYSSISRVN